MRNRLDVFVNVRGGGFTGQGGAISQGIARALKSMFGLSTDHSEDGKESGGMAKKLRDSGILDARRPDEGTQEIRPQGRRKAFQFSKR